MFAFVRTLAVAAIATLVAADCTFGATEVFVAVDTDVPPQRPMAITVTVRSGSAVTGDGGTHSWVRGGTMPTASFPASFAVTPGGGAEDGTVTLVVTAHVAAGGTGVPALDFERIARFPFTPRTATSIRIFLALACGDAATGCTDTSVACTVSESCEEQGLTCGDDGRCVSQSVSPVPVDDAGMDASDLTPHDGGDADASIMDAADGESGAMDARPDVAGDVIAELPVDATTGIDVDVVDAADAMSVVDVAADEDVSDFVDVFTDPDVTVDADDTGLSDVPADVPGDSMFTSTCTAGRPGTPPTCDVEVMGEFLANFVSGSETTGSGSLMPIVGDVNAWWVCLQSVTSTVDDSASQRVIYAGDFVFEFSGPDAVLLNTQVGSRFSQGGEVNTSGMHGGFVDVEPFGSGALTADFYIWPPDTSVGVYFESNAPSSPFVRDGSGGPVITTAMPISSASGATFFDHRPGSAADISGPACMTIIVNVAL